MFDYKDLNLKIGLECHQQLSNKKLFCNCLTKFKEEKLELEFIRKLRATAGETGNVDVASIFEESKHREFIYHGYKDEYCLIDCDESPPDNVNQDALITALSVAKLLKLNLPDEIQVMRKIIIDGSACSSFQRTMLIGFESKNSFIQTSFGNVRISGLCLEEDACKIEKTDGNKVYYSLSRQGIPLIEISTEPDIQTPEQAKETAEKIGMILRSFSSIKRGIGTIRQDVNLSIKNGARVEIKGFQELRMIPKIIDYEIARQFNMILQGKKVEKEVRKANENGTTSFLRPLPGSARMYIETDIKPMIIDDKLLKQIKIPELISDKIKDLQKNYNLSEELANEIAKNKINFEKYYKKFNKISKGLLASILINKINEKEKHLEFILENLNSGKITKDVVDEILTNLKQGKKINLEHYKTASYKEIENEIKNITNKKPELSVNAIMGILMGKYRGKIDGKKLIGLIKKYKKE